MKFGKSYNSADEATSTGGGGGDWMKYFKNDATTFRILQEPGDWVEYWEHFNPGGFPFPCTGDRKTCPGCTSSNEKMQKASKKIAFNVLEGEWVNVYKVPKTVADKLHSRSERIGTITDRDYTIYKIQSKNRDGSTKTDYDVEGNDKIPVAIAELEPKFKDMEKMLADAYEQAWGDDSKAAETKAGNEYDEAQSGLKAKLAAAQQREWTEGKKEDIPDWAVKDDTATETDDTNEYDEADLRAMDKSGILAVCDKEGLQVPNDVQQRDVNGIVDWLLEQ